MVITGSTDLGNGLLAVTVDHDPQVVATDAPAGSIIIDVNGKHFRKLDAGPSTNLGPAIGGKSAFQEIYPSDEGSVLNLSLRDLFDRSPFGNDPALEGAAAINGAAGRVGSGLRLDGTAGTVGRVLDNASLQFTNLITIEAWIRPNTDGADFHPIVSKTDSDIGNGWNFIYQDNGLRVTFRKDSGAGSSDTFPYLVGQVPTSVYTHVAITYDDSTNLLKTYINGELKDSRTFVANTGVGDGWTDSADDLIIGNRLKSGNLSTGNFFDGDLSNVRVYNRVLSDEEIRIQHLRGSNYQTQSAIVSDRWKVLDTSGAPWMDFNKTNRVPLVKQPLKIVDVFSAADLPTAITAPDGVSRIPLALNTRYYVHNTFVWPRCLFPVATAPNVNFDNTDIIGASFDVTIQLDGDSTPHFWGREMAMVTFRDTHIVDVSNAGAGRGTTLFDLVGGSGNGFSFLVLSLVSIRSFKRLGDVVDLGLQIAATFWSNCEGGLVTRVNSIATVPHTYFLGNVYFIQTGNATIKPQLVFQGAVPSATFSNNNLNQSAGDAAVMVDSAFAGELDMLGSAYGGAASGDFFRPDVSQSLASMANADIAISAFADSPTNPGTDTSVSVAPGHGLTRGQVVRIGDAGAPFDGLHTILRVAADETSFDINVTFTSTTTGNVKLTRVTTVGDTSIVNNEKITIAGTTSYNGTFATVFAAGSNSFDIPVAFVADDATGTVTSTGQTQKTVGVNASGNGAQADSLILGFGEMNANAVATVIAAAGTYQALDVSGLVDSSVSERFTLTNATNGIYTYNGNKPISAKIIVIVNAVKSGATQNYRFATSVNGAIPVFASAAFSPMEVQTTKVHASVNKFEPLTPGDTIQIMVAGDGHSDNLTITDFTIEIEG